MDHARGDATKRGVAAGTVVPGADDTLLVADSEWTPELALGTWRGTVAGCEASSDLTKIIAGACSANSATTGVNVPAMAAVKLNRWRSKNYFCVLRTKASYY